MTEVVAVLHLCALNDPSGNPRRAWVGLGERGSPVIVTDEGYDGEPEWSRDLRARNVWPVAIEVTPNAYESWLSISVWLG